MSQQVGLIVGLYQSYHTNRSMGIMILQFCFLVLVQLSIPALSAVGVGSNKTSEWQTLDGMCN